GLRNRRSTCWAGRSLGGTCLSASARAASSRLAAATSVRGRDALTRRRLSGKDGPETVPEPARRLAKSREEDRALAVRDFRLPEHAGLELSARVVDADLGDHEAFLSFLADVRRHA